MEEEGEPPAISIVSDYGPGGSSCGYCSGADGCSVSHGMQAESMSVDTFQELLDRGWRRSGRWLYKPVLEETCCALITIRLDVRTFQPSREQRRVERRWAAYLAGAPLHGDEAPRPAGDSPKRGYAAMAGVDGGGGWGAPAATGGGGNAAAAAAPSSSRGGKRARPLPAGSPAAPALAPAPLPPAPALRPPASPPPRPSSAPLPALDVLAPAPPLSTQLSFTRLGGRSLSGGGGAGSPFGLGRRESLGESVRQALQACVAAREAALAQGLQAALAACVADGKLPAADYPAPAVLHPSARQRRHLPADVQYTSTFALQVAAAAARAAAGGAAAAPPPAADAVAAALLRRQRLPAGMAADAARGHLNYRDPATAAAQPDAVEAAGGGAQAAAAPPAAAAPQRRQPPPPSQPPAGVPRAVPRHFEVRTVRPGDPSVPGAEFELYRRYQVLHHGDDPADVTRAGFRRFLCDSPLVAEPAEARRAAGGAAPPGGFGSFHQQYWLDGRLVAVGVVDVLPRCLSSVYLFWEPALGAASLGKLSSLREIEWVRAAGAACPSLRYYYLGFFLDSCHRMRYKADFGPADLLCPRTHAWVPADRPGVRAAAAAAGGRVPNLAAVPGALEGLGAEHRVAAGGQPAAPPRPPTEAQLGDVRLFVRGQPAPPAGGALHPHQRRQGQVVKFGTLLALGLLSPGAERQLRTRLRAWLAATGPEAAAGMACVL